MFLAAKNMHKMQKEVQMKCPNCHVINGCACHGICNVVKFGVKEAASTIWVAVVKQLR